VGLVAMAVILLLLIDRRPRPGITPENFKRLYVGMPEADAKAILGRKADWSANEAPPQTDEAVLGFG